MQEKALEVSWVCRGPEPTPVTTPGLWKVLDSQERMDRLSSLHQILYRRYFVYLILTFKISCAHFKDEQAVARASW